MGVCALRPTTVPSWRGGIVTRLVQIGQAERLTEIFGSWPSFHDAEVLRVRLDHRGVQGATLEADIHLWEMTSEVDDRGYFVLRHHTLTTLRFDNIFGLELQWFDRQNVIADLTLEPLTEPREDEVRWHIDLGSSVGMEATFDCGAITVVDAQPFDAPSVRSDR